MNDKFAACQHAITLRLSRRPVKYICQVPGRSEFWPHEWRLRYVNLDTDGLYDLTRPVRSPGASRPGQTA
jgi:hypothetical protein